MTWFRSRRRTPRPNPRRNIFFLSDSTRQHPRWRRHRPSDGWDRLAPSSSSHSPDSAPRPDFLSFTPGRHKAANYARDDHRAGKSVLIALSLALLLILILC